MEKPMLYFFHASTLPWLRTSAPRDAFVKKISNPRIVIYARSLIENNRDELSTWIKYHNTAYLLQLF